MRIVLCSLLACAMALAPALPARAAISDTEAQNIVAFATAGLSALDDNFSTTRGAQKGDYEYVFVSPVTAAWRTCSMWDFGGSDVKDLEVSCQSAYHPEMDDTDLFSAVAGILDTYFASRPHTVEHGDGYEKWTQTGGDMLTLWVKDGDGGRYYEIAMRR